MHQLRIVVDNQYNPDGQEGDAEGCFSAEVSHESFMKLVRPAIGYIANADAMAILKRGAFIIFSEKYIYFRPPSEKHVPVKRVLWENSANKDILTSSCKPTLGNWKLGGEAPSDYPDLVAWEVEWLKETFRKHDHPVHVSAKAAPAVKSSTPHLDALLVADGAVPQPASASGTSCLSIPLPALLPGVPKLEPSEHRDGHEWLARETRGHPVDVDLDRASEGWSCITPVKQEPALKFHHLPQATRGQPIELDTPSPQPHKKQRCLGMVPNPDALPGLPPMSDDEDIMPAVGASLDEMSGGPGCHNGFNDVCLILAMQSIGLPVTCDRDGPFSVSFANHLLLPYGVQLCQKHCRKALPDGNYIVHDKALSHFFALQCREGLFLKKDGGTSVSLSSSMASSMLTSENYTFYFLKQQAMKADLPFDAAGGATPQVVVCPLTTCVCAGCSGALTAHLDVESVLYTLEGPVPVIHRQKQCAARNCRTCYAYNYRWSNGQKINTVALSDLPEDILFVNPKKAFSLRYLQYHEELLFRGHLSSRAVSDAYHTVHSDRDSHIVQDFHKLHNTGLFYYMAVREFEVINVHTSIVIDDELNPTHLDLYESLCFASLFPPPDRRKVTALVIDGHQKVKMQCEEAPTKRAGRPRKSLTTVGNYTNGWMVACDPTSGRILGLTSMFEPEDNEVASRTIEKILWLYPKMDCLVYDRACSFKACAENNEDLQQIQFYCVDAFHAYTHSKNCPCNPRFFFCASIFSIGSIFLIFNLTNYSLRFFGNTSLSSRLSSEIEESHEQHQLQHLRAGLLMASEFRTYAQ